MKVLTQKDKELGITQNDMEYDEIHPGWLEMQRAFLGCGCTGNAVTAYMNSRSEHDPMDDDPNRIRG